MSSIEEIEKAIEQLPPDQFREVARWVRALSSASGMIRWTATRQRVSSISYSKRRRLKPSVAIFESGLLGREVWWDSPVLDPAGKIIEYLHL